MATLSYATADYKDTEGLAESFKRALESFGIKVYDDPSFEGTDTFGFILSDEELTDEQLKALSQL